MIQERFGFSAPLALELTYHFKRHILIYDADRIYPI